MICRPVALDWNTHAAFAKFALITASGAEAESSLTAFQVGDAHTGKQDPFKLFWGEGHWHTND